MSLACTMKFNHLKKKEIIEYIFESFSERELPENLWIKDSYEARYIAATFVPVKPREFTFEFLESNRKLQMYYSFINLFTTEAYQYYLPSLLALCIEDFEKADALPDVLLHTFHRHPPFTMPIDKWVAETSRISDRTSNEDSKTQLLHELKVMSLKSWFFENIELQRIEKMSSLSNREREVIISFIDFLEITEEYYSFETISARAVIQNGSLANRLGASSKVEVCELLKVVDLITYKFPQHFDIDSSNRLKDRLRIEEIK